MELPVVRVGLVAGLLGVRLEVEGHQLVLRLLSNVGEPVTDTLQVQRGQLSRAVVLLLKDSNLSSSGGSHGLAHLNNSGSLIEHQGVDLGLELGEGARGVGGLEGGDAGGGLVGLGGVGLEVDGVDGLEGLGVEGLIDRIG